ncbi:MAG: metallophosphoesterase [Myxococcota bacterium]
MALSRAELTDLLLKLFSIPEMRIFVSELPYGFDVINSVTWDKSPNDIVYQMVDSLGRRGMIDRVFFETLISQRPRRVDEVHRVAKMWDIDGLDDSATSFPVSEIVTRPDRMPVNKVFRITGYPPINFVEPKQMAEIRMELEEFGPGLVVDGASGVGKTTTILHVLADILKTSPLNVTNHSRVIWIRGKSTGDRLRLQKILDRGDRELQGYLVIDDFHNLPQEMKSEVSNLVKLVADESSNAKIVLIGINPVGASLVNAATDVTGRFTPINMNRQPNDKIRELIEKGERAVNVRFQHIDQIVASSRHSFFTAQMMCRHILRMEGIKNSLEETRRVVTSPTEVADRVHDQLKLKYQNRLLRFANFDRSSPPGGATLVLLWMLAQNTRDGVTVQNARFRYPMLQDGFQWLLESNLATLFDTNPEIRELLFYNRHTSRLSLEDPQLDYYLNTLSWSAFARDSGHTGLEWAQNGPRFNTDSSNPRVTPVRNLGPTNRDYPTSRILHLSDLHIEETRSALELYDRLREDLRELLDGESLTAVVVSGDIVNRGTSAEYQAASHFFRDLKEGLSLTPRQILLVPGNHDMDWAISKQMYIPRRKEDWPGPSEDAWHYEDGRYVEVARLQDLQRRFSSFADFYYEVCNEPYPLDPTQQTTLRHFPDSRLLLLGLNSSWAIDHHHTGRADINARALGRALERIDREPAYRDCLRIATWHHPISSGEDDRIRDTGFLERLARAEFRIALHGHIHQASEGLFRYDTAPGGRQLNLLSAGTFGAPVRAWRPGFPLQYQLLEVSGKTVTVHTRRRENPSGTWKPDARWTPGPGQDPLPRYTLPLSA